MGLNVPPDDERARRSVGYVERINAMQATPAELRLQEKIAALPKRMDPMPRAKNQHLKEMDVGFEQGRFLAMLMRDLSRHHERPLKVIDVGTFCGHSAGVMARSMPRRGKVITCDITGEYLPLAQQYWEEEGVRDRIDFHQGPAKDTMQHLLNDPNERGTFDMVFIDAEKTGYPEYYKLAKALLRPGGKMVVDNVRWSDYVANKVGPEARVESTPDQLDQHGRNVRAIRRLNETVPMDPEMDYAYLGAADGILVADKLDTPRQLETPPPIRSLRSR